MGNPVRKIRNLMQKFRIHRDRRFVTYWVKVGEKRRDEAQRQASVNRLNERNLFKNLLLRNELLDSIYLLNNCDWDISRATREANDPALCCVCVRAQDGEGRDNKATKRRRLFAKKTRRERRRNNGHDSQKNEEGYGRTAPPGDAV